jgi:hypothetical protein
MAVWMHTAKKEKETKKIKDPLWCSSHSSNNITTTKTTSELLFKSGVSKKGTVHNRRCRPINDLRFLP